MGLHVKHFVFLLFSITVSFSQAQIITTYAGNGIGAYGGDNGPAVNASISEPEGIAFDDSGNVYIADEGDNVVRKVNSLGIITTVAGSGVIGYSGDNGPATSAKLTSPTTVAFDKNGNMYISDTYNNVIRKVTKAGIITTFAGNGFGGYSADGVAATSTSLDLPECVTLDDTGNVYIADAGNNRIRKVNLAGIISTIAGNGMAAYGGDNGIATAAKLSYPTAVLIDTVNHKIFISDNGNNRIRVINSTGIISTCAGTGIPGYSGNGAPATNAQLKGPHGLAFDKFGNIFIADAGNSVIRKINSTGIISAYAGNGTNGYSGDNGPAILAKISSAPAMNFDAANNLYIGDYANSRVRKVSFCQTPINVNISAKDTICIGDSSTLHANGALTYTWSANAGNFNSDSVVVKPIVSTTYSVAGISGQCANIDSVKIVVNNCSGGLKQNNNSEFSVYPNPAEEIIFINSPGESLVKIYDARGAKVKEQKVQLNKTEIDIRDLSKGVYFLQISDYTGIARHILIKQ
ncbi:MAG TPA: T9SS type A sorting domain-containing protein [Bacteroidia bacterium]|jgi:sugar lactone lactonase YvrE|nr:T9SS type A sorting domain-containing protein [Bacteroidia bacterium]